MGPVDMYFFFFLVHLQLFLLSALVFFHVQKEPVSCLQLVTFVYIITENYVGCVGQVVV